MGDTVVWHGMVDMVHYDVLMVLCAMWCGGMW